MMGFEDGMMTLSKYVLVILSIGIMVRCFRSLIKDRYDSELWGHLCYNGEQVALTHWENIIGRSRSCDIRLASPKVSRVHAVLCRNDNGEWRIYDIFSKGGVWINGVRSGSHGQLLRNGDEINLGGELLTFCELSGGECPDEQNGSSFRSSGVSPAFTLLELTVIQAFMLVQHCFSADKEYLPTIALAFLTLAALEWCCFFAMRVIDRSGFEIETLAFYLTTLGLSVAASSAPEDMLKQTLLTIAAIVLFLLLGWWLRRLNRTMFIRLLIAASAILLMIVNFVFSDVVFGAKNWLSIGEYTIQPSELVKVGYIYSGASTLDRLFRKRDLFMFIGFSAFCVIALALIGDFGAAFIFFVTFLVISFMRSGSIATVVLSVTGAGLAGFLAVSVKPYIAQRFSSWGHVWEDVNNTGFQQARAMSAAASGGLYGKGAGAGWFKNIFAADTDMVFAVICEEQGFIIGVIAVLAMLTLAVFAVRSARHGRSAYYSIAACAAVSMLLVQMSLNVFGAMDILPFTGVTFPFVSKGGTSLISCWMLMAFIKSADNRRGASFAVSPFRSEHRRRDKKQDSGEDLSNWEVWQPCEK